MLKWYDFFPPTVLVKRANIDHEFIPLNVMTQWYQGRVPFTPGQLAVGNQGYSTTQYGGIHENLQEHQRYNIGYQNYSNQGYASNDVQPAASQSYQNAQHDLGNYYFPYLYYTHYQYTDPI